MVQFFFLFEVVRGRCRRKRKKIAGRKAAAAAASSRIRFPSSSPPPAFPHSKLTGRRDLVAHPAPQRDVRRRLRAILSRGGGSSRRLRLGAVAVNAGDVGLDASSPPPSSGCRLGRDGSGGRSRGASSRCSSRSSHGRGALWCHREGGQRHRGEFFFLVDRAFVFRKTSGGSKRAKELLLFAAVEIHFLKKNSCGKSEGASFSHRFRFSPFSFFFSLSLPLPLFAASRAREGHSLLAPPREEQEGPLSLSRASAREKGESKTASKRVVYFRSCCGPLSLSRRRPFQGPRLLLYRSSASREVFLSHFRGRRVIKQQRCTSSR